MSKSVRAPRAPAPALKRYAVFSFVQGGHDERILVKEFSECPLTSLQEIGEKLKHAESFHNKRLRCLEQKGFSLTLIRARSVLADPRGSFIPLLGWVFLVDIWDPNKLLVGFARMNPNPGRWDPRGSHVPT